MPNVERRASEGLKFNVLDDGTCEVAGLGSCKDTNIVIPADDGEGHKVTSIGNDAFCYCHDFTSITILDSVTKIGNHAFYWCEDLTSITIPDSVTSIGYEAFKDCRSLMSITIPDGVTHIGDSAFDGCDNLQTIVCSAEMKDKLVNMREFYGLSDNVKIFTPEEYAAKEKDNGPSLDD